MSSHKMFVTLILTKIAMYS